MKKVFVPLISITTLLVMVSIGVHLIKDTDRSGHDTLPDYPTVDVKIANEDFTILMPRNREEWALGLGAIDELPEHYGMLFVADSGELGIWMKGMKYAIDIIWLDKNDKVIHIVENAEPSSYPEIFRNPPLTFAARAIEINSGEVKRLGVKRGDLIKFKR